jgi:hypothetical protein
MLGKFLAHGSNGVLVAACLATALLAAAGVMPISVWCVLAGAMLFYLTEYGTHRFMFHARPSRFAWVRHFQHRLHYDHHVEPARLDLLFLPLWYVVPNALLIAAVVFGIWRDWAAVVGVLAGASGALLHYEWVHYIAHIPYRPRTAVGRYMKKYHLWHHFKNEKLWFGVSNPSMDYLYRTYRKPEEAERSGSTRVLFD